MEKYYFTSKESTFEKVLDCFSNTEVHSCKTSSIPLAEFWMPKNKQLIKCIVQKIGISEEEYTEAEKIFEYPVYSKNGEKKVGKPSMTDLMIRSDRFQIAVEGKFTEDLYETISEWLKNGSENSQKPNVLKGWLSYIKDYCDSSKWMEADINKNVVYQFLHRTASACYDTEHPILVYQLFYDVFSEESKLHQIEVAKKLYEFALKYLFFKKEKIQFFIVFTPILNVQEIETLHRGEKSSLFIQMKTKNIYDFAEPVILDCLNEQFENIEFPKYRKAKYSNEEFIDDYEKLWKETWHRGQTQEEYINKISKEQTKYQFSKEKASAIYNLEAGKKLDKLQSTNEEEWRCLSNPGYTKYAVSSLGRVAFKVDGKYTIIFQDDFNNNGYLKLDPNGDYNLDHNIEVYKLIAMGFLGKKLDDGYDVHHKINDGYDCRPDNLVLLTRSQHNAVHFSEKSKADINLREYLEEEMDS